jgi:ACR3 family arsenite efflux pump ArsB
MNRQMIERHQAWLYLAAILIGLAVGLVVPALAPSFEVVLWPVLGVLLFATFTQVPLTHLSEAFRDRRFMAALLTGNFVLVPLAVWGLLAFLPSDPAIRLGVLLG